MQSQATALPPLTGGLEPQGRLRAAITAACRRPEPGLVRALLDEARQPAEAAAQVTARALELARRLREDPGQRGRSSLVQGLLQEFALSSHEGVALMCLAEALLRIPDAATRDALIRDKIGMGDWRSHVGHSGSLFVNAATWGLLLTGQLVAAEGHEGLLAALTRMLGRGSEPLIRRTVDVAVRLMGEQFVSGETIEAAMANGAALERQGFRHSYDMLGEAAMTAADAGRYRASYETAIHAIGQAAGGRGVHDGPGISVKLSALHPRYCRAQRERVLEELYPVLLALARLARDYQVGFSIDAEESERLELSLDLLERLCLEPVLADWPGLGFVVQAYQKRCPAVIDHLADLAARSDRRLMVRLVKGAYWDSEIKRAQSEGLAYPVYTRKAHTDLAYLACARRLLAVPAQLYPQFATHNAHTVAAIRQMADPRHWHPLQYEYQCLHGMGEPLYRQVVGPAGLDRPCRIYAPVGRHEVLLAYLVRRLLENGANTSFVHQVADRSRPLETLVQDPVAVVEALAVRDGATGLPHPAIPAPESLYGPPRRNSRGHDLTSVPQLQALDQALHVREPLHAGPLVAFAIAARAAAGSGPAAGRHATDALTGDGVAGEPAASAVCNPADPGDVVGWVTAATSVQASRAVACAEQAAEAWAALPVAARAGCLEHAADRIEAGAMALAAVLVREAGKTAANALAEVREAVDFLRYYAAQSRTFGAGTHEPLGVVACISPWNFPLAIFCGQVAAALAAGNAVLAKPAEQTPLVAAMAVHLLHEAGIPPAVLQLLPGAGEILGAQLVADARVQAVVFTGSTEVARLIQRTLAGRLDRHGRPPVLVAETGGQNAMIVDSSALCEQAVADILASAFDSAGQRCSALRLLCVQEEAAPRLLAMLRGAMTELTVGNPAALATDVGPVIDAQALAHLQKHVDRMRAAGQRVLQVHVDDLAVRRGSFLPPTLVELDGLHHLTQEVFGPVLHVLTWRRKDLEALLEAINRLGYGLTQGLHTRIEETVTTVLAHSRVGNLYVNRNMVGAVVGVQPFGGEGLSGTGPKAGGPLYLYRLLARRPENVLAEATAGLQPAGERAPAPRPLLEALAAWAAGQGNAKLAGVCRQFASLAGFPSGGWILRGPTGQEDRYRLQARDAVLCLADSEDDLLAQLAAVLAVGAEALWPERSTGLLSRLPPALHGAVLPVKDWPQASFDLVLHHGSSASLLAACHALASRAGPLVSVEAYPEGDHAVRLERLLVERSASINTAAAGGNAGLMTLED